MKEAILLLLIAALTFLMWNSRQTVGYSPGSVPSESAPAHDAPVPPDVTQAILVKVQQAAKTIWPLETLYVKNAGKGVYDARFMFFNTDGYYGTQYDVKARVDDGAVQILSKSETAVEGDAQNPGYVPDSYQSYNVIEQNLDQQLRDALKNSKSYQTWNPTRQTVFAPGPVLGLAPAPVPEQAPSPVSTMSPMASVVGPVARATYGRS